MTDTATLRALIEDGVYGDPALSGKETREAIDALDALLDRIAALEREAEALDQLLTAAINDYNGATDRIAALEEALQDCDLRFFPATDGGDDRGDRLAMRIHALLHDTDAEPEAAR